MSISSNLLFPVEYSSREIFTCFSAVLKKLLSLFCSEGYLGQKLPLFLCLDLNYAQNDEILLTKNNHLEKSICPALLNSQPLSKVLHKTNLVPRAVFINSPGTGHEVLNSDWPIKTHNPRSKILESRQTNIANTNFRAF